MKINSANFGDLREQMYNHDLWNKDRFVLLNYEAGTGKSVLAQKFIGEMAVVSSYKVLYVQKFSRDNELGETVDAINKGAGKPVAAFYSSDYVKGEDRDAKIQRAVNAQVLCITHSMYRQICKKEHRDMIKDRDVLIIDEYPDLLEKTSLSLTDIAFIWSECVRNGCSEFEVMSKLLKNLFDTRTSDKMTYQSFDSYDYMGFKRLIPSVKEKIGNEKLKILLNNCLQIMKKGGYLYEDGIHTFNDNTEFMMLKNNIILDANAGFDYRYKMSNKFDIKNQSKEFDYKRSQFLHYEVSTTKYALQSNKNFLEDSLNQIDFEKRGGILFITDKDNKNELEKIICQRFFEFGNSILEIEEKLNCKIRVDYFGNIVGVNIYRDYDTVVILKTPNFDYLTYAMTYFFYRSMDGLPVDDQINQFEHEEVEMIRHSIVAGEIYQAIKRVNRDNSHASQIYVFSDYPQAIDIVLEQLPNIQYEKRVYKIYKKPDVETKKRESKQEKMLKSLLLDCLREGRISVTKHELKEKMGIKSSGNFRKLLIKCKAFMIKHGIELTDKHEILFKAS